MNELISSLSKPEAYTHSVKDIQVIETHISWIFLTGDYAYKVKKSVDFGFLNYLDLETRHQFCLDEVAYNQALASAVYLDVQPITQGKQGFLMGGKGEPVEYAVRMRQFPQANLFSQLIDTHDIGSETIQEVAQTVADFHIQSRKAAPETPFGTPASVLQPVVENFDQAEPLLTDAADQAKITQLRAQTLEAYNQLEASFALRKQLQHICECHGDLHLGNITYFEGKPVIFDCIEFNDYFRWLDPMADIGFMIMDLLNRGQDALANRFLSSYLEKTGDYAGVPVLNFYVAYRAMVRAKIELFQIQGDASSPANVQRLQTYRGYADIAWKMTEPKQPRLFITFGVSGSGKSTAAQIIVDTYAAIRIRADVERKRLFPNLLDDKAQLYSAEKSEQTYQHLYEMALSCLQAGHSVVIDAACLKQKQRTMFINLARSEQIPFVIVECTARTNALEQAISQRQHRKDNVSDATASVLEKQLSNLDALSSLERYHTVTVDFTINNNQKRVAQLIENKLNKLDLESVI